MRRITALAILLVATTPAAGQAQERFATGLFLTYVRLERIGSTDHDVGTSSLGLGGRMSWQPVRNLELEGELAVHPNAGVSGYRVQGFAGAQSGVRFRRMGLFAKIRPGFLYFSKDPFGVTERASTFFDTRWADSLEPALDIGGVFEYYSSSGLVFRVDLGDTVVRYGARSVLVAQLEPRHLGGGFYHAQPSVERRARKAILKGLPTPLRICDPATLA